MRAYFIQHTPFGNYKTLTHCAFIIGTALDWLCSGDPQAGDHVKCLLSLACCAIDQCAIDGG
eukprot:14712656-Alexandrium_andersonii.AAC.1